MDLQRSILSPLGNKAKHLSAAARQQLADIDTDAIRERVAGSARQFAGSARDAAYAASEAAAPYLQKIASASRHQLHQLGDAMESNARAVAKRWSGKRNIVTRHPIAATLLVGSLSYLAIRAWRRARAAAAGAKPSRAPRKSATKRTPASRANGANRAKQVHATRSTSIN